MNPVRWALRALAFTSAASGVYVLAGTLVAVAVGGDLLLGLLLALPVCAILGVGLAVWSERSTGR